MTGDARVAVALAALDRVTRHVMVGFSLKGQGRWQ